MVHWHAFGELAGWALCIFIQQNRDTDIYLEILSLYLNDKCEEC